MDFLREHVIQLSNTVHYGIMSLMLQDQCNRVPLFLMDRSKKVKDDACDALIFNPHTGAVVMASSASNMDKAMPDEDYERYLKHTDSEPFMILNGQEGFMVRFLPIGNDVSCHKCHPSNLPTLGVIKIKHNLTSSLAEARNTMMRHILFSLLAIALFFIIFLYVVIKLINDPLGKIMETINYLEKGDLAKRVAIKHNDIIGKLAEKINHMAAKRQEAHIELEKFHHMQMIKASQMASVGEMATCIAHDIKNPLACMSSALQVIDGEMEEGVENKMIIKEVIDQIGRIDHSVKRILEYAKPEITQKSLTDVDEILDHTLSLISQFASLKRIRVNFSKGPGKKKTYGDRKKLEQLFLNVSLNGIEAMGPEGILSISSGVKKKKDGEENPKFIEVGIRDNGCGIREEDMPLIFNPLFTTKEKGTGLGLSISAKILEEHNGFSDIESASGRGTNFKIYLPLMEEG